MKPLSHSLPDGPLQGVPLETIDERLSCYRLRVAADEAAMLASLKQFGQLSPVVVTVQEERLVLIDGFKRLRGARQLRGMRTLWARRVELDERRTKAAVFLLNQTGRRTDLWEESWIVQALVREDGLSQVEVGQLLGRHKSWVCRRLALIEKLADPAKEDLRLGLLSPGLARQLIRLPAGNQVRALGAVREHSLTEAELRGVTDLLLGAGTREKENYLLDKPRQALRESQGVECRSWDPRLSVAGNRVSRHLASLLDGLDRMENWLRHRGRGELRLCDRDVLRDGFAKLAAQTRSVGELTDDFLQELDKHEVAIQELLERYPDITVTRLWQELRAQGYRGGYTVLRQRVKALRPRKSSPFVERFETGPGQQAQMDYSLYDLDFTHEGRRRVNLFSYILGYSRRQYLRFVESQDMETTLREHVRAFESLGGVAWTCLYDNMKVVVARYEDGEPIYNTRFLAFATHYGYRPVACRPRHPQTKGKVERPFDYVEKNLLNGRTFRSLDHLNEVTSWWLAEVADVRIHGTTQKRPIDLHAEEQPRLIPLPVAPYEVAEVVYRTVDHEGYISYGQNRYSVPWDQAHPGQVLPVKITETEIIIYSLHLCELTRHARLHRSVTHQTSQHAEHRPPRDAESRRELARQQFQELGPLAVHFLEGLLRTQRRGWEQARQVLACLRNYRREDLRAALERAHRFGAYSLGAVERILAVQARPKSSCEHLADQAQHHLRELLGDDPTPPRDAAEYQRLLFERGTSRCIHVPRAVRRASPR